MDIDQIHRRLNGVMASDWTALVIDGSRESGKTRHSAALINRLVAVGDANKVLVASGHPMAWRSLRDALVMCGTASCPGPDKFSGAHRTAFWRGGAIAQFSGADDMLMWHGHNCDTVWIDEPGAGNGISVSLDGERWLVSSGDSHVRSPRVVISGGFPVSGAKILTLPDQPRRIAA